MKIFLLPDLGEGLPDAEVVKWYVKIGDEVKKDQNLASLETAKALIDIPSPYAGRIKKLFAEIGNKVKTGEPLIEFESIETETSKSVVGQLSVSDVLIEEKLIPVAKHEQSIVKATPFVRSLANSLKVDLTLIQPTGPEGAITSKDVRRAAKALELQEKQISNANITSSTKDLPPENGVLQKLNGPRRTMAETMHQLRSEVVPVTVMEDAKLINYTPKFDVTVQLIKAMANAIKTEPALNTRYDHKNMTSRLMSELNVGIAMDTSEGLFVPIIHQADQLSTEALRWRLEKLKEEVSTRTIDLKNLQGATILLSNFGKFGGRYATPVVVPPMVATLGVGKLREEVVIVDHTMQVAVVLPLSLTVDHRAITGGEATRFLQSIIQFLQNNQD